ncbi:MULTISPECIES: TadE/TadG family type IV pilus assembly protein [unclassified Pseudomonas]|uniref:TadE/TadG family type IV pilus assembly protein n=1 Tax=unclassified Pseudomonas TaxID=196821 RepID=UPI0025EA9AF5|nr:MULTISPECIES: TadE/TadG family type IV pilus assembly protein [unclassified Pseudomonas]
MRSIPRKFCSARQRGAAAIEFALVFVIFFAIFYGLVTYSLPLLMMQSFNNATAEAVRQSVAISPGAGTSAADYANLVTTQATTALTSQLSWLPPAIAFNAASDAAITFDGKLLRVRIDYPKSKLTHVVPVLKLPGIGDVPNLPTYLSAEASLQLAP